MGMTVRVAALEPGVQVSLEHPDAQRASAENLVTIYRRADAAGEEWSVLDLIVKRPRRRPW
jgi:hypothetical protein